MIVNASSFTTLNQGFRTAFQGGFDNGKSYWEKVAMPVSSSGNAERYGWMGKFASIREWVGDRVINNLSVSDWTIKNRKFENTIEVARTDIEDDTYGIYSPMFAEMGADAKVHPDSLVFQLMKDGFATACYDGQYFFDSDHPVIDATGAVVSVSNVQAGAGEPWFMIDTSRAVKPFVFQTRVPYEFQHLDSPTDHRVFMQDKFLYGLRARANAGYALWQLAFGSKATLDKTNYAAARVAMSSMKGDYGKMLNIKPMTLVVGPALEEAALGIVNVERDAAGASNVWKGTAELIVVPWLA